MKNLKKRNVENNKAKSKSILRPRAQNEQDYSVREQNVENQ